MRTRAMMFLLLLIGVMLAGAGAWWYSRRPLPAPEQERTVLLYFYDLARDTDVDGNTRCGATGLVAVKREIPQSARPVMKETIDLLLEGKLMPDEKARGITTEFPLQGVELISAQVDEGGDVTLVFNDPQHRTSGGACRVGILRAQIEATARQFVSAGEVLLMPEELFQP